MAKTHRMQFPSFEPENNEQFIRNDVYTVNNDIINGSAMMDQKTDRLRSKDDEFDMAQSLRHSHRERGRRSTGRRSPSTWGEAWALFAKDTTLHGVKYVFLRDAFTIRRLLWLLLLVGGLSFMLYQIVERIIHYYDWPISVNVKINYNRSLLFPALTVCNQNVFKASSAASNDQYEMIEHMYAHGNFTAESLLTYNASNLTLDAFYTSSAHDLSDFLVQCTWNNHLCGPENFTQVFTQYGVCYTFNGNRSDENSLYVSSSGADHGLKLVFNVEQYEYMPGPHNAAGAKVFLHDKHEFPQVGDLGLAIPTGTHSFLGNSMFLLQNLPPPHGQCVDTDLMYYPELYTDSNCKMECMTKNAAKVCGCRAEFMPSISGVPPVCTLWEKYTCYQPFADNFHEMSTELCHCSVPCRFQSYHSTLSYASTSHFIIDKLLDKLDIGVIKEKYIRARETTHRFDKNKLNDFSKLIRNNDEKLADLITLIRVDLAAILQTHLNRVRKTQSDMLSVWKRKNFTQRFQLYAIQKNFLRARDAMEERTLSSICNGFQVFQLDVELKLRRLLILSHSGNTLREMLYADIRDTIDIDVTLISHGIVNLTDLISAYYNGTGIFNYKFSNVARKHNIYIVPKILMRRALYHTWNAEHYGLRIPGDLGILSEAALGYKRILDDIYHNATLDEDQLNAVSKHYTFYCRRYFHNRANLYFESLEWPVEIMQNRISEFQQALDNFQATVNNIENNAHALQKSLAIIGATALRVFDQVNTLALSYLSDSDVGKMGIMEQLLSHNCIESVNELSAFFLEVMSRGQNIYDDWTLLADHSNVIWKAILTDVDSREYYEWRNYTNFLQNYSVVSKEINHDYVSFRDANDLAALGGHTGQSFIESMADMVKDAHAFNDSLKMGQQFVRDNFMFLDVFYKQLSYEHVTQHASYDTFALLADIGGSMGLFAGASMLTVFEIIDFITSFTVERLHNTGQRQ